MSEAIENCSHDCSSCEANCDARDPKSFLEAPNPKSSVKKVIGVVSGKGGVGKSLVASLIASGLQKKGIHTGILDADITGPSIPKAFGLRSRATANDDGLIPVKSAGGVDIMSINLLLNGETDPVIWRGPIIAGTVKQFWSEVVWEDIDCLVVDMPPGTGDVPLTVFQSLPIDGIVIVTSPQDLVSMIVSKAVKMAAMMNVPIIGIVENMSYLECPDCGRKIEVFGHSRLDEVAAEKGLTILDRLPIQPQFAALSDAGKIEQTEGDWLQGAAVRIEELLK